MSDFFLNFQEKSFSRLENQNPSLIDTKNLSVSQKSVHTSVDPIKSDIRAPPTTPREIHEDFEVTSVPITLPKLKNIKLPLVREIGVKESIKRLAEIYDCKKFSCNLIQFWFLDFMTDSLWKVQDEFQLPDNHQKVVLEWIGYIFNLVRANQLHLSRRKLFRIFNEAMTLVEQFIETGCEELPLPDQLFTLKFDNEDQTFEEESSYSSDSSLSCEDEDKKDSYLAIKMKDGVKLFDLSSKVCAWDTDDDRLSSTIETVSENEIVIVNLDKTDQDENAVENVDIISDSADVDLMFEDFYKPDMRTPLRFLASEDSLSDSITISYESESVDLEEDEILTGPPAWTIAKKKVLDNPCPSNTFDKKTETIKTDKQKEDEALQAWYDYHLWQFRKVAMNDSKIGWTVSEEKIEPKVPESTREQEIQTDLEPEPPAAMDTLKEYFNQIYDGMQEIRQNRFINTCVIMAIKQIIYDYFSDSFQFSLTRMAYLHPQYFVTQELNDNWWIPKQIKGTLKRPKAKKKKQEKTKMPKKEKDAKVEKKSKPKPAKEHTEKPPKKEKLIVKQGLTAEEIVEKARLQQEELEAEEMERVKEENRTLLFPLTDAITDSFINNIFATNIKVKKKGK